MKGSWFRAERDVERSEDPAVRLDSERDEDTEGSEAIDGNQESQVEKGGERQEKREMFFRATFAAAAGDKVAEGIRRFGEALRGEFGLE